MFIKNEFSTTEKEKCRVIPVTNYTKLSILILAFTYFCKFGEFWSISQN